MDDTQKRFHKNKPKSNLFLGCFGFSVKQPVIEGKNPSRMVIEIITDSNKEKEKKKKKKLFYWSSFRFKSSGVARTVPVDSSEKVVDGKKAPANKSEVAEKVKNGGESNSGNYKRNKKLSSSKGERPAANQKLQRQITDMPEVTSVEGPEDQNPRDQATRGSEESIAVGNGKQPGHVEAQSEDTWQKRQSFRRKIDAIRAGNYSQQPLGSPGQRSTSSYSEINPAATTTPPVAESARKPPLKEEDRAKRNDPMVGMSIILVTLVIMLVWGRVCAILCTCAWFYLVPLLRTTQNGTAKTAAAYPDMDSEEYKKRVVLEGLLERRSHRTPAV